MPQSEKTNSAAESGLPLDSPPSRIESDPSDSEGADAKTYLDVSYQDKNTAKALGAKCDRQEQSRFVPPGVNSGVVQF